MDAPIFIIENCAEIKHNKDIKPMVTILAGGSEHVRTFRRKSCKLI